MKRVMILAFASVLFASSSGRAAVTVTITDPSNYQAVEGTQFTVKATIDGTANITVTRVTIILYDEHNNVVAQAANPAISGGPSDWNTQGMLTAPTTVSERYLLVVTAYTNNNVELGSTSTGFTVVAPPNGGGGN